MQLIPLMVFRVTGIGCNDPELDVPARCYSVAYSILLWADAMKRLLFGMLSAIVCHLAAADKGLNGRPGPLYLVA